MALSTTERRADLDVIFVHFHAAEMLREAVTAIRQGASVDGLRVRIIVADNGSTPRERALLESLDVELFSTGRNAGYAGAANIAYSRTTADCVILMNEDVIVLPGCLRTLHAALMSGASVAGPQFFWDRDRVFRLPCTEERSRRNELVKAAGRRGPSKLARARQEWRRHARRHWLATTPLATTALSGALLAFHRDTWTRVGGFDEQYQLYFEENDWLIRVAREGLQCVYLPTASAIHLHNPGTMQRPERRQWEADSFLRFGNRYYGRHFMRRLRLLHEHPARGVIAPATQLSPHSIDAIPIGACKDTEWPIWVELSPSPDGYPAAAARVSDRTMERWPFPAMRGLETLEGTFHLQFVDALGRELRRYRLDRSHSC